MAKYSPCINEACFFTETPKEYCVVHHIFNGNPNRKLSEKWGMKIYVVPRWHNFEDYSIHMNEETDLIVKRYGQEIFEAEHGHDKFVKTFGRSWI